MAESDRPESPDADPPEQGNDAGNNAPRKPSPLKRRGVRIALLAVAVIAIAGGIFWLIHHETVGKYIQATDDAYIDADMVTVAPKVGGYVEAVLVSSNQQVRAGQPLVKIDPRDYQAQVAQLRWNFLDFGRGAARVKSAGAERDEAEAQYRAAVLGALRDAEDALSRYSKRRVAVATVARAKEAADEAAMLMRARLRAGTASLIEMLDAERQQIAAEQNLLAAEAGFTGDFVSLQKALGLGWSQGHGHVGS